MTPDGTRTSAPGDPPPATEAHTSPPPDSSLSSDSIGGSRFVPGTVLAGRYRIVGPIGRGGMGEVYRAEDLKLAQTVALKFLPEGLDRDPARLNRFFGEVRVARQVTHPNVCRVYDTGEFEGQHFISMEYVDGEDMRVLLRRIGRLPREKAVQIARQLCAGLAAAHAQGILHRDLKPANVMVDGRGRVRITDFGLAGLAEAFTGDEIRAGTPTYQAPEQLDGRQVSVRSDLYALGLVLYELFTGKPAYEARTPAELRRMHDTSPPTPSSFVEGFDESVERVILRCLEKDPTQRPSTALSVAAALPGGDPLAQALAAGEIPSPEMVADAGGEGGVKSFVAVACLAAIILGLVGGMVIRDRQSIYRHVDLDRPPEALAVTAREILANAGHETPAVDRAYGFAVDTDYIEHVRETDETPNRWDALSSVRPGPVQFWYRQSPRYLVPTDLFSGTQRVQPEDPANDISGMARVRLDDQGRLLSLTVVPPQHDDSERPADEPDWTPLFERAGLDPTSLEPVRSEWNPLLTSDSRSAWIARYPGQPDLPIRVEAAAYAGKPVSFEIIPPWRKPERMQADSASVGENVANAILLTILFGLLIGGILLARRNLRLGRGDRRGAFRLATVLFTALLLNWVLVGHHVPRFSEVGLLFQNVAWGLFFSGMAWVFYVALEPHVRRLWPDLIISWTRLLTGRYRDPLVGRAILAGGLCYVGEQTWVFFWQQVQRWIGGPPMNPSWSGLAALESVRQAAGSYVAQLAPAIWIPIAVLFLILLLRVLLRRQSAAVIALVAIFTLANVLSIPDVNPWIIAAMAAGLWCGVVLVMIRFGMLAVSMWFLFGVIDTMPATTDLADWYAGRPLAAVVLMAALACYGFWISLAGGPLFARDLLPDQLEAPR